MYTVLEKGGVCSPKGFTASGICAGIKASGNADMALLKSEKAARCFAVFTTNKVKAAPVLYDKAALEHAHFASAVVVNSGNANACTGEQGLRDAERMAVLTEEALKLTPKSVLVCSTGVIGHLMPMDKIEAGIPKLVEKLHADASEEFGRAILTTDLALKSHAVEIQTEKGVVTIGGACKGSGMIHPEFYAAPNENSQVMQRLVFGDRLVSLDMKGLYRKVQYGNKVGYVDRRAVGFFDELSSVQEERLKQVDKDRGTNNLSANSAMIGSQLDGLYEDRVTYSSFGRRDPFVEVDGLVEDGINIDQVELVGIIWESDVPVAILVESKNPSISYTVKEGDKILNGKVLKITQTDVLFLIQEFGVSRRYSMGLPDKLGGQKFLSDG